MQGKKLAVVSFAWDVGGRIGYSVRAGVTASQPNPAAAYVDSTNIVFGRTYPVPSTRPGVIADLAVDRNRGNVFLSNLYSGRLEVWQQNSKTFDPTGIFVGSEPWGMTMSRTAPLSDTLYVANSGGTNLSRVYIGAATPSGMKEDLNNRIVTRISLLYKVTETRDPATGKIRLDARRADPLLGSPAVRAAEHRGPPVSLHAPHLRRAAGHHPLPGPEGRRRPTSASSSPSRRRARIRTRTSSPTSTRPASRRPRPTRSANDILTLCDHPSGTTLDPTCASSASGIAATISALQAAVPATDMDAQVNLDHTLARPDRHDLCRRQRQRPVDRLR